MAIAVRDERIDLRISGQDKDFLEKAAGLKHLSLSSYILSVSSRQAQLDLAENESLVLSNRDRDLIMSALENIEEPNQDLKNLFK